jgi:hypothetical protein
MLETGTQPHHKVGCSIANIMGVPAAGFGGMPNCGTLSGLLA